MLVAAGANVYAEDNRNRSPLSWCGKAVHDAMLQQRQQNLDDWARRNELAAMQQESEPLTKSAAQGDADGPDQ